MLNPTVNSQNFPELVKTIVKCRVNDKQQQKQQQQQQQQPVHDAEEEAGAGGWDRVQADGEVCDVSGPDNPGVCVSQLLLQIR